jgi:hypothetical protein
MVSGLPQIDLVDQVCDSCLAEKQKRTSFPSTAKHHTLERLELVHGDLCCPMTPAMLGGRRYFLLLVDDVTQFMWPVLLDTKDEAFDAFTALKT